MGVRVPPFAVLLFTLFSLHSPLAAERFTLNPRARAFEMQPPRKERVDTFDFEGIYPELETISINAHRKKHVEFLVTGEYPMLESITYEGGFGMLMAQVTGAFPKLSLLNILCGSCAMQVNLKAQWERSCAITIRGLDQDMHLTLPKNVGLVISTKTSVKGKVIANESLKKTSRFGLVKKTFENELAATSEIVLTVTVECRDGQIFLN